MIIVTGSKNRKYEVLSRWSGTSGNVFKVYYNGVLLAVADFAGAGGGSCCTLEQAIEQANIRADSLGLEVIEQHKEATNAKR